MPQRETDVTARGPRERGTTLIEVMVVVLVIGILIAIGLPTFLGAKGRAQDKAAEAGLRNGIVAAKTFYSDGSRYTGFTDIVAKANEPSLTWYPAATAPTGPKTVTILVAANQQLVLYDLSAKGVYFGISVDEGTSAGTRFCQTASAITAAGWTTLNCSQPSWT